jgi:hypothetical protein
LGLLDFYTIIKYSKMVMAPDAAVNVEPDRRSESARDTTEFRVIPLYKGGDHGK